MLFVKEKIKNENNYLKPGQMFLKDYYEPCNIISRLILKRRFLSVHCLSLPNDTEEFLWEAVFGINT